MNQSIKPETDEEIEALRDENKGVVISVGTASASQHFHIPEGIETEETICDTSSKQQHNERMWKWKSYKVYPKGHKPYCKRCLHKWRQTDE